MTTINNTFNSPNKPLNSPTNVQTGGGATPEQVEIIKSLYLLMSARAGDFKDVLNSADDDDARDDARDSSEMYQERANALEAILAEREELLRDRERLNWLQEQSPVTLDDGDGTWSWEIRTPKREYIISDRGDLREALDEAIEKSKQ